MKTHVGAHLTGMITRSLPARRWQATHWMSRVMGPKAPFVGRFHQGQLEVHPGEVASMAAFYLGFYEREVTIWCLEQMRQSPPSLLIDVGANFGYYPLLFGLLTGGQTKSLAFEPEPSNYEWLCRNVKLNPDLDITTIPKAVGSAEGFVEFDTAKDQHNLWSKVSAIQGADNHWADKIRVPVTTLDKTLDERGIHEAPITLIDVEGFEGEVLKGMSRGLAEHRYKKVLVEFHPKVFPRVADMQQIAQRVLDAGYRGYRLAHFCPANPDRSRGYYDLSYQTLDLQPINWENMGTWAHFLFEAQD